MGIAEALTFDDVTLIPSYSAILPSEADTSVKLSKKIKINIPILSSAMDTVTEYRMAVAVASEGGLGVIHRNMSSKKQAEQILKVKRKKLMVGAACGVNDFERVERLLESKADLIVVDTAHGHSKKVIMTIKELKKFDNNITKEIFNVVSPINSMKRKSSLGGTSPQSVKKSIQYAIKKYL